MRDSDKDDDTDIRAVFHRIDDGPPLGIDAQDVITRGRRIRTRRTRLVIAGSAVAVTALVTLAALAGTRAPDDPVRPADPPATTVVPAPTSEPVPTTPSTMDTPAATTGPSAPGPETTA
jgi:hypothetical protein